MHVHKPFGKTNSADSLRISFCDGNCHVATALHKAFHDVQEAEILEGNLLDLECDALLSPANSFGDMGGGIDKSIDDFFAGAAQQAVQEMIQRDFYGEIPVGVAAIVPLPGSRFRHLVCAPTMRIPGSIGDTINAYLAMRAAFVAILKYNRGNSPIRSLAVPGLGTGVGGIDFEEAASQMRMAYEVVIQEKWKRIIHPAMAPYAFRKSSKET